MTEVERLIKSNEQFLRDMGVNSCYLFGSWAMGNNRQGSDVDLICVGVYDSDLLRSYLSDLLGAPIDLYDSLFTGGVMLRHFDGYGIKIF